MEIEIIFKIAGIGLITAIITQILKQMGKDEIATMATLAGLIIVLVMILTLVSDLFIKIKGMFDFF